jgi:cell division protein FtsB
MITHNLYKDRELEELKVRMASYTPPPAASGDDSAAAPRVGGLTSAWSYVSQEKFDQLQQEVTQLQAEVASLRDVVAKLESLLQ